MENLIASDTFPWARSISLRENLLKKEILPQNYLQEYVSNAYTTTKSKVANTQSSNTDNIENTFQTTCYLTIKWFMNTLVERTNSISSLLDIDVRIPYAKYRLFEYVYSIPARTKLGLNHADTPCEKYLLREAYKDEIPNEIYARKKSPFPKTYSPLYTKLLEIEIDNIIRNSTSPILDIIDVKYLLQLTATHGKDLKENWFGQLMTYPQILAYLIQINMWLKEYDVQIELNS